jgi:phosphoribosylanthranilate isomerase
MTWVKICGITSQEDATAAVEAGADALGFVFVPGTPRLIAAGVAAEIVQALPASVTAVGVFVNQPLEEVLGIARQCRLRAVQLQGDEPEAFSRALPVKVIKAIRVRDEASLAPLRSYPADAFLLDAFVEGRWGGTGVRISWDLARQAEEKAPIILAGGLLPETVGEAVRFVRPYGVDVSSGVERSLGRKDHQKVREFIAKVRSADCHG